MNSGGDVLARGARSAQFAAGGSELSEFEMDIAVGKSGLEEKYGLTADEVTAYIVKRKAGERFSVDPIANQPEVGSDIVVLDKRRNYGNLPTEVKTVEVAPQKYPDKTYGTFTPLLDRILIKRCPENKDMELLEDGSVRNKKTGLIIAAKYRQHSNIGIVLAVGKFVILGGQRIPMAEVVSVGDRVTYGDYNSEVFHMSEERVQSLCDAVQFNYVYDEDGLRVVRVQDVRGVEHPIEDSGLEAFRKDYNATSPLDLPSGIEGYRRNHLYEDENGKTWKYNHATKAWDLPADEVSNE